MLPVTTGRGVLAWVGGVIGAAIALGAVASAGGGEIRFTIGEGRVTLIASDALLGDILAEWGRAGDTRFVDAGELHQVPVSLHLVDVPEVEALRLLLRPAAGYLAVPRAPLTPGASVYDRIKILAVRSSSSMPRSVAATRAVATAAAPAAGRPEDGLGNEAPPAELSEAAQIERLQRLLHPRGIGDESAAAATETQPRALAPQTTPRPGMIADPGQLEESEEPGRRYRGSPRAYDPFTAVPAPPPR